MNNTEIAERIKKAREMRRITQKEVALCLGKQSSNAISEIERGNVNVTAEDIFKLADLFNVPIMYFYGQDYPDDFTADFLALVEHMSPEEIEGIKALAVSNSQLKTMMGQVQGDANLQADREVLVKVLENLNPGIYALSHQLNAALQIRKQIEELLGIEENNNPES